MPQQTPQPPTSAPPEERPSREQLVETAVRGWTGDLAGLGGHDPLRYYRDLPLGTLDLTHAHPSGLAMLFAGRPTRLTDLVREPGALAEARRRARAIAAKAAELAGERGIAACWLAVGTARWTPVRSARPCTAPVLLRSCVLRPRGAAEDDFDVDLGVDVELNPALVDDLAAAEVFLDVRDLLDPRLSAARFDPGPALQRVSQACAALPGFTVERRLVVSTFTAAPLHLAADLAAKGVGLAEHDVVAALAGDPSALAGLATVLPPLTSDPDPRAELVALDLDAAQQAAVEAVRAGSHLVLQAPPGTGRTQALAALLAALSADGRRTLLVSQKRASIESVLHRLDAVGLGDLVLDLPPGGTAGGRVAAQLWSRVERVLQADDRPADGSAGASGSAGPTGASGSGGPTSEELVRALEERRDRLTGHVDALHRVREPWGVSAHDAQLALAVLTERHPAPRSRVRVRGTDLERLTPSARDELAGELRAAAESGAFAAGPEDDPWFGADLPTPVDADQALRTVTELATTTLPRARQRVASVLDDAGIPVGRTLAEWGSALALMASVRQTLEVFGTSVWDTSLADVVAATASTQWREANGVEMDWWQRRGLVRQARQLLRPGPPPPDLHEALALAHDQREQWQELAGPGSRPRLPAGLASAQQALAEVERPLAWLGERLAGTSQGGDLLGIGVDELEARLGRLGSGSLEVAPLRTRLHRRLSDAGLAALLPDLAERGVAAEDVGAELDLVWWTSLLEHVAAADARYGEHDGELLRTMALEYAAADREHVAGAAARVQRVVTDRLGEAVRAFPEQVAMLREEATRVRGHGSPRDMARSCPDLLAAAAPVWAMSPLAVPSVLDPGEAFDVVVVEEASRLAPAVAVPAISRARQVVLAGDERLLGPSAFSTTVVPDPVGPGTPEAGASANRRGAGAGPAGAAGAEPSASTADLEMPSVLGALRNRLPVAALRTDVRCADEFLLSFADEWTYERGLLTHPAAGEAPDGEPRVRLELVEGTGAVAHGDEAVESTDAEVDRVVELVLEHARARPQESLGVVTLGRRHAEPVREALRRALAAAPDLAARLASASGEEPFVVAAVDDVQGDTRDAVLLSVGYGRTPHGRVLHRFGALGLPGGERRLAVAVTRARRRLTVVAAFQADDLDAERLSGEGPRQLRELLAWAAASGRVDEGTPPPDADPLLADLADRLRAQGLRVVEGYGRSAGRIDLAVGEDGGPLLVAVEGDGPAYAATATTRDRDRLRIERLQRLGWTHLRLWSTDVFRDPAREVARVVAVVRAAAKRERQRRAALEGAAEVGSAAAAAGAGVRSDEVPRHRAGEDQAPRDQIRWDQVRREQVRWDNDRPRVVPTAQPPVRSARRPDVPVGRSVEDYTEAQLDEVVAWIRSDTVSRTDEQVAALARQHLGFARRTARLDAALDSALARAAGERQTAGETP